jgi:hypothetical protein
LFERDVKISDHVAKFDLEIELPIPPNTALSTSHSLTHPLVSTMRIASTGTLSSGPKKACTSSTVASSGSPRSLTPWLLLPLTLAFLLLLPAPSSLSPAAPDDSASGSCCSCSCCSASAPFWLSRARFRLGLSLPFCCSSW